MGTAGRMVSTWTLRRCYAVSALLICIAARLQPAWALSSPAARLAGAAPAGDAVYGVGEEFTVQTDASLVQLAHTSPRENVAAVKQRLGAMRGWPLWCLVPTWLNCALILERTAASGADVDERDDIQYTALHWAAVNGHVNIGRLLLDRGAEVDALNDRERAPSLSILSECVVACPAGCPQNIWILVVRPLTGGSQS